MISKTSNFIIDFSINFENEIEYCNIISNKTGDITVDDCKTFLKKLITSGVISVNERSKGILSLGMGLLHISYETCVHVGEDWDDDIWEDCEVEQQIEEVI